MLMRHVPWFSLFVRLGSTAFGSPIYGLEIVDVPDDFAESASTGTAVEVIQDGQLVVQDGKKDAKVQEEPEKKLERPWPPPKEGIPAGNGQQSAGKEIHGEQPQATPQRKPWYEGLPAVKVLRAGDPNNVRVVGEIWQNQESWDGHFNDQRFAVLLVPGIYEDNFILPVSFYTGIYGVGASPEEVQIQAVQSLNGPNGHATDNFWRSVEGVQMRNASVTWAVSQGSPIRRSIINGALALSDDKGYSSGGFLADVHMNGTILTGMQQQWLFRNVNMPKGIYCPFGWNYVFVGVQDLIPQTYKECAGKIVGKVTEVPSTPRIAEKPYIVLETNVDGSEDWRMYVPNVHVHGKAGATWDYRGDSRNFGLDDGVYVAKPGDTAAMINDGIREKTGLLITPGIYPLDEPIIIKKSGFVVLGLGFPTLIASQGRSALQVSGNLFDVRVAGLVLEAGTQGDFTGRTEPLLRWGETRKPSVSADESTGVRGVMSDIFARVGSFKYRGCKVVRADTLVEINTDDVILDNTWLWHADHDDCGTDPGNSLNVSGNSDLCNSEHGLVVNGARVTAYGIAAEHVLTGHMVSWRGEDGEAYFYQSELPYHQDKFSSDGHVAYEVAPTVQKHKAFGMGVYIIQSNAQSRGGYLLPATVIGKNLMTVVIIGEKWEFKHTLCVRSGPTGSEVCHGPDICIPKNRCVVESMPLVPAPSRLFLAHEIGAAASSDKPLPGLSVILLLAAIFVIFVWVPLRVSSDYWLLRGIPHLDRLRRRGPMFPMKSRDCQLNEDDLSTMCLE